MAEDLEPTRSKDATDIEQSSGSSRSTDRPPSDGLQRYYSAQYLDDSGLYHHRSSVTAGDDADSTFDTENGALANDGDEYEEKLDEQIRDSVGYEKEEKDEDGENAIREVRMGIPDERDVEAGHPKLEQIRSARSAKDPNIVSWDGPDDPANPKNWSMKRKWAATIVVSMFTFISPVSSSMIAPDLTAIARDLGITQEFELQLTLSIFVLAYAIGPLILGPLSEVFGRAIVLQLANLFYLIWNLACGFARTPGQLIAFRFLSGLGGSAPLAIGGGVLSDCWKPEERGMAISVYSLMPLLGPAVGPIAGGFIAQTTTWRWVFWATTITDALIQLFGLFFLQETYPPTILKRKVVKLRKETGNMDLRTEFDSPDRKLSSILGRSLIRPFRLLGTQPIVQVLALYMAYLYGLMYLMLSTFPTLWTVEYGESVGISGLNYISLGVGFFIGTQISAPMNDRIYRRLKKRNSNVGKPEFRVPLMFPAALLVPTGLFWYGWTAQAHTHWILPNIGAAIFAIGTITGFQMIQTYIVDSYTRFAASAVAAATVLRSMAGFGFPLFAPYLFKTLGNGWGNSLLGFVALGLGVPWPFVLWRYGEALRAKSKFAAGG